MDWQLKLMQFFDCFGDMEGTLFENHWEDYGISADEQKIIETAYDAYYKARCTPIYQEDLNENVSRARRQEPPQPVAGRDLPART